MVERVDESQRKTSKLSNARQSRLWEHLHVASGPASPQPFVGLLAFNFLFHPLQTTDLPNPSSVKICIFSNSCKAAVISGAAMWDFSVISRLSRGGVDMS